MTSDRIPPHDLNAEMSLLGSMMLGADVPGVSREDFYRPGHALIFDAVRSLRDRGEAIDAITVAAELTAAGTLDRAGGKGYLLDVTGAVPIASNAGEYARIVKRTATLRSIIGAASRAAIAAYEATDADDVLASSITELLSLQQTGGRHDVDVADAVESRLCEYATPTDTLLLPGSGVRLHFGDLTVIGGRPGTGKTAYAIQVADALSAHKRRVGFLSYEMDVRELVDRLVSRAVGMPSDLAYDGLSERDLDVYRRACTSLLSNRSMSIKQASGMREGELAAWVRSFAAKGGRVVVIDYLQIAFDSRDGDYADLTRLMRLLQQLAKSTGVAIIALSQYSREGDGKPRLSHLRGSGAIEQEAANVALMWTPDDEEQADYKQKLREKRYIIDPFNDKQRLVKVHWAKVRHGESRVEYHTFDGSRMTFEPLDREV